MTGGPERPRVLVTGGTGLIGRHVHAPLLALGYEVHSASARGGGSFEGVASHRLDVLDTRTAEALLDELRPTHLLHLAWSVEPGKFWSSPDNAVWRAASLALARAFAERGGRRAVFAGTCAEYAWDPGGVLSEASTPIAPATVYGREKAALLEDLTALDALSVGWGRVFWLYGPGEDPRRLVASIIASIAAGRPAPTSPGTQRRDYLHAADVAGGLVGLLDSVVEGPVNIGSGEPVAVREVAETAAAALGRPDLLRLGALPAPAGEPELLVADGARLRDEVGFRPRFGLADGIADTVAAHRAAAAGG